MISKLLIKSFVRDHEHTDSPEVRLNYGIFSGSVGLTVNILLAALKFAIGLLTGSVAISADAVNNLSDAGNSVVTVFGFKMAAKPADREHPFGHGRLEYVAGVVVAVVIIAMGLNFLVESVRRIIDPHAVTISPVLAAILAGSLLFKVWLFFFYRRIGTLIDSRTIRAMAFDSVSDIAGTLVVLLSAVADQFTRFPVDGCAGVLAALLVIYGGIRILHETIDPLLGELPGPELVEEIRSRLLKCRGIKGVHDIIVHNYGPNQYFATAHAEVDQATDIFAVHDLLEQAEAEIGKHMPVHLLLHCDPCHASGPKTREWQDKLENAAAEINPMFKIYDLHFQKEPSGSLLTFSLLVPHTCSADQAEIERQMVRAMERYPDPPPMKITVVRSSQDH